MFRILLAAVTAELRIAFANRGQCAREMHLQIADTSATLMGDLFLDIDCLRSAGQFIVHVFSRAQSGI